jgi:NADH-quinone oxidoreductase subunit L
MEGLFLTSTNYFLEFLWLIPLFPLLTAMLMLFLGRFFPQKAINFFCVGGVVLSFVHAAGASILLLGADPAHRVYQQILFEWITPGAIPAVGGAVPFIADWGYLLDPLSSAMSLFVIAIALLVHIYSVGYMNREGGYDRFFGYLNLFLFFMLTLVLANNLLLLLLGWEGVALCSFLLISFDFQKKSTGDAASKAFLLNCVGDVGLFLGIFYIAGTFGTVRFTSQMLPDPIAFAGINETLTAMFSLGRLPAGSALIAIVLLLFIGAIAKSAQFPLQVWLPDATTSRVPATALLCAATTLASGVYLLARLAPICQLAPLAMDIVAAVGALTAIVGASLGLVETDITKVLVYATISQFGYTFLGLGIGAFSAGVFHLMTYGFIIALLFLGAGGVIHALSGEQDLRKMGGGLWRANPAISWSFLIGALAMVGAPPLAGFFSKSEILGDAFARSAGFDRYLLLWAVALLTSALTAIYMFRLFILAFFGLSHIPSETDRRIRESPRVMTIPLMILAGLSVGSGCFALPTLWGEKNPFAQFLDPVIRGVIPATVAARFAHQSLLAEWLLMGAFLFASFLGLGLAYTLYVSQPRLHAKLVASSPRLQNLLMRKYYVDEIYSALFVNRIKDLSAACALFDAKVIDDFGVDGAAWLVRWCSKVSIWWDKWVVDGLLNFVARLPRSFSHPMRLLQSGVLSTYAVFILAGLALILAFYGRHMYSLVRSLH